MSRYRGPSLKKIRCLGALPGLTRKTPKPESNPKRKFYSGKKEQYCIRLQEKHKLRFYYGLTEFSSPSPFPELNQPKAKALNLYFPI